MLGLDNAGKTTILKKLSDEDITTIMPTQASSSLASMDTHVAQYLHSVLNSAQGLQAACQTHVRVLSGKQTAVDVAESDQTAAEAPCCQQGSTMHSAVHSAAAVLN